MAADYTMEAGKTYRVVWNEHSYSGYANGYKNFRDTRLLNFGVFGLPSVDDLITSDGVTSLNTNRSTDQGHPFDFPSEELSAAAADIFESVTSIDNTRVENVSGDDQTDAWSDMETWQRTADFELKADAVSGEYALLWQVQQYNADQNGDHFQNDFDIEYDLSVVSTVQVGPVAPPTFPAARPGDYDPDKGWNGAWVDLNALTTLGGGRYNQQLVVLGHRAIYFQELT